MLLTGPVGKQISLRQLSVRNIALADSKNNSVEQGDQIGRIFAFLGDYFLGAVYSKLLK
jgi:hypothetical protein